MEDAEQKKHKQSCDSGVCALMIEFDTNNFNNSFVLVQNVQFQTHFFGGIFNKK